MSEQNAIIEYKGAKINLYSDDRDDYVNLTDIANAIKGKGSQALKAWIRSKQTLEFLQAWEKKNETRIGVHYFDQSQMRPVMDLAKSRLLTIGKWMEMTKGRGIFTRIGGAFAGTFAHKDIGIRLAAYLSPEFELHLVEEIQRLKEIERKKNSFELLTTDQVLYITRLKEVFKYVSHQIAAENANRDVFVANSNASNPFSEFNKYRNEALDIDAKTIDERIKQYCIDKNIALTTKITKKTKREKILMLDTFETIKIAVWDFLTIKKEVNAMNIATLVEGMVRIEQAQVLRDNETDLFHSKQDLQELTNFSQEIGKLKEVVTARELLAYREKVKKRPIPMHESDITAENGFDVALKGLLAVPSSKSKGKLVFENLSIKNSPKPKKKGK